ncbi:hypothetical protein F5Y15DRAFT_418893 [Xylariaceae sp. FL0016]|nr:hypothetical protein F5Y15DRAFT_418893 [Xylariaceae sp. FL0016]
MAIPHCRSYPPPLLSKPDLAGVRPRQVLAYFVCGNPGLIDYYDPFLSTLRELLDSSSSLAGTSIHLYGQDLAGFKDADHKPFTSQRKPYDLEFQIQHTLSVLKDIRIASGSFRGQSYDDVLLIGHSIGCYVALELCHRLLKNPELAPTLKITSGILLFPTISHMSSSPSGWKLDLLRRIPILGDNAYRIAQGFLRLLPYGLLHWIVRKVMGFPPHAAQVTTDWLKSQDGVWQTLHLGMDEMKVVKQDTWGQELWEVAHEAEAHQTRAPKFYFFYGRNDHWISDRYRDEFIEKRQRQIERTRFIIDEGNLPHAFCIRHSETVAEKVNRWINELYGNPRDV